MRAGHADYDFPPRSTPTSGSPHPHCRNDYLRSQSQLRAQLRPAASAYVTNPSTRPTSVRTVRAPSTAATALFAFHPCDRQSQLARTQVRDVMGFRVVSGITPKGPPTTAKRRRPMPLVVAMAAFSAAMTAGGPGRLVLIPARDRRSDRLAWSARYSTDLAHGVPDTAGHGVRGGDKVFGARVEPRQRMSTRTSGSASSAVMATRSACSAACNRSAAASASSAARSSGRASTAWTMHVGGGHDRRDLAAQRRVCGHAGEVGSPDEHVDRLGELAEAFGELEQVLRRQWGAERGAHRRVGGAPLHFLAI